MKRIISILISISLLLMSVPAFAISGTGTESNPYLIFSTSDIAKIHDDLDGYYKLTSNINMSGVDFEPIGNENEGAFTGTIDGNGYTISNLDINLPDSKYVGFVGYLEGTVKNLNLTNVDAYGYRYVGGLVGYAEEGSYINNCSISGKVDSEYQVIALNVGGIVGYNYGEITDCKNSGNISGNCLLSSHIGGIAGYNTGKISNCENTGKVEGNNGRSDGYPNIGGIAGCNYGDIVNSENNGNVSGDYQHRFGGIAGCNYGNIISCKNIGSISDTNNSWCAGGIAGANHGNMTNCINEGFISGDYVGGIAGRNYEEIATCINNGKISSIDDDDYIGGIAGYCSGLITDCENIGNVNGRNHIGGIVGNCSGLITDCENSGDISGATGIGGIAGDNNGEIKKCENNGNVSGNAHVGGIAGTNFFATIADCINRGSSYKTNFGGIVGSNDTYSSIINNCLDINGYTIAYQNNGIINNITCSNITVNIGETGKLQIELYGYEGKLTFTSHDETIATVDDNGIVSGKKVGTTSVTVSTELGVTSTAIIKVTEPSSSIVLNKTTVNLYVNSTYQLSASVQPSNTTDLVIWSSSDENSVTVSDNGLITGISEGTATIIATTTSGLTATCYVTVKAAQIMPTSVTLSDTYITLAPEDAKALTATLEPSNTTETTLSWTSSDESVATVDKNGVVTAVSNGFATIRGKTTNGLTSECVVKVISATGTSVLLDNTKASPGGTAQVKANIVKNPGLSAYKFKVNYDADVLTPVSITPNAEFGGTFSTNLEDADRTELNVLWYSGKEDVVVNGELFTVNFKVNDSAAYGDSSIVSIEYGATDICDTSGNYIAIYTEDATVSIEEPMPGDIYEDNDVNVYDLTLLARYITSLETFTERQEEAADVNNDGRVDILDVIRLAQYLVNWSGIELMSLDLYDEPTTPAISVGSASVNELNEAEIPVYIKNNSGILGYRFVLDYNAEDIEILSITPSELINKDGFNHNLGAESQATDGLVVSCFASGNNITDDGVLFTIKVRYKNPADTCVSPISVVDSFDNMGNENATYVTATYETGYALGSDYIVANKVVGDTNFSCELYFDDSYAEQSAKAIIAFYDGDGRLVQLMPKDITVKPGKVDLSIDYDKKAYATYKLMIWEGLNSLKPITDVK